MAFETSIGETAKQHTSVIALDQIYSPNKNADHAASASKLHGEVRTANTTGSSALPHLDLVDNGSRQSFIANSFHSFVDSTNRVVHEAAAVGADLTQGAYHEVKDHPGKVFGEVAKGIGYGVLGVAAIAVLPEVALVGVVAVGAAAGGYMLGKEIREHAPGVIHDAKVVAHADQYSQKEVSDAHSGLQHAGAAGVDAAATSVGALMGGALVASWLGEAGAAGGTVAREAGGEVPAARPRVVRPGGAPNVEDPTLTARAKAYGMNGEPPAPRPAPEATPRRPVKPPHGNINQDDPIFTARAKVYGMNGEPPAPRPASEATPRRPVKPPHGHINQDDPIFTARAQFVRPKPEAPKS